MIGLAAAVWLAAAAGAQAAPATPAAIAAAAGRLAKENVAYEALSQEAVELLVFDAAGANKALTLATSGADAETAKAWRLDWQAQLDAKLQALDADIRALPSNEAALAALAKLSPEAAAQARKADVPGRMRAVAETVVDVSQRLRADVEPALGGDASAQKRLRLDLVLGARSEVLAENAMAQSAIAVLPHVHPQRALLMSALASNEAVLGLYDALAKQLNGDSVDLKAVAATTRTSCAEARDDARQVAPMAKTTRAAIAAQGRLPPAMRARWLAAWDTYNESGEVELEIAGQCDKIADGLDQGMTIPQAIKQATDLKALVTRRTEISASRQATLAAQAG